MNTAFVDHIVLACPNLKTGNDFIFNLTGVMPFKGGQHLKFGTHNSILPIGDKVYLEIIAPDPQNKNVTERWMAVDQVSKATITRWSINSKNIISDSKLLNSFDTKNGEIITGERIIQNKKDDSNRVLKWTMTKPISGNKIDIAPFLLDWSASDFHPCDEKEKLCQLVGINLYSKDKSRYQELYNNLNIPVEVKWGEGEKIEILLDTPMGRIRI